MPEVFETPEGFIPEVTITIQVSREPDYENTETPGTYCTIEGNVSKKQWCNIFNSFGSMVATEFSGEFEEFMKTQAPMSDKEKHEAYKQFCQIQLIHMIGHLQEAFSDVAKDYLESKGKIKDMQA